MEILRKQIRNYVTRVKKKEWKLIGAMRILSNQDVARMLESRELQCPEGYVPFIPEDAATLAKALGLDVEDCALDRFYVLPIVDEIWEEFKALPRTWDMDDYRYLEHAFVFTGLHNLVLLAHSVELLETGELQY